MKNRRSIRLKKYDYSQAGLYFITTCVQNRQCLFGQVVNKNMILNENGKIVTEEWQNLVIKYPHIKLHKYVTMPNHFHSIVEIMHTQIHGELDGANNQIAVQHNPITTQQYGEHGYGCGRVYERGRGEGQADPAPTVTVTAVTAMPTTTVVTVGNIVGYFKYQTTKKIDLPVKLWQRNYYEHIIRTEQEYQNISQYIVDNPKKWPEDKFYGGKL
jgi:REP element-mobilizing transposase RayT